MTCFVWDFKMHIWRGQRRSLRRKEEWLSRQGLSSDVGPRHPAPAPGHLTGFRHTDQAGTAEAVKRNLTALTAPAPAPVAAAHASGHRGASPARAGRVVAHGQGDLVQGCQLCDSWLPTTAFVAASYA